MSSRTKKNYRKEKETVEISSSDEEEMEDSLDRFTVHYNGIESVIKRLVIDGRLIGYFANDSGITNKCQRVVVGGKCIGYYEEEAATFINGLSSFKKLETQLKAQYKKELKVLHKQAEKWGNELCATIDRVKERENNVKVADESSQMLKTLQTELLTMSNEMERMQQADVSKDRRIENLKKHLVEITGDVDEGHKMVSSIQKELDLVTKANAKILEEKGLEIAQLKAENLEVHKALNARESDIVLLKGAHLEMVEVLDALNLANQESKKVVEERETKIARIKAEHLEMVELLKKTKLEMETLSNTAEKDYEIEILKGEHLVLTLDLCKKEAEVEDLIEEAQRTRNLEKMAELEMCTLRNEMETMSTEFEKVKYSLMATELALCEQKVESAKLQFGLNTLKEFGSGLICINKRGREEDQVENKKARYDLDE